jgi:hypothetical protein
MFTLSVLPENEGKTGIPTSSSCTIPLFCTVYNMFFVSWESVFQSDHRSQDQMAGVIPSNRLILSKWKADKWSWKLLEYRQPARLTLHSTKLCTKFRIFRKKIFFGTKVTFEAFLSISQNLKVTVFREAHKRNFELVDETLIFQGHLNVFCGSFMASLCSSRWSDQNCKTDCVTLKTSFQSKPVWAILTDFLARYRYLKWGLKFRIFYKTSKILNDFSRENHGHGGHEHGVRRGVFGDKLSFKKMSAGGRLCTLQENPHFWVPMIKVRPPDGISIFTIRVFTLSVNVEKYSSVDPPVLKIKNYCEKQYIC